MTADIPIPVVLADVTGPAPTPATPYRYEPAPAVGWSRLFVWVGLAVLFAGAVLTTPGVVW